MTDLTAISASMVEAVLLARDEHETEVDELSDYESWRWRCACFAGGEVPDEDAALDAAREHEGRAILAAALAECNVLVRWGYLSRWSEVPAAELDHFGYLPPHPPGRDVETWERSRLIAESLVAQAGRVPRRLIRRLVITTPAEVVPAGEST